MRAISRLSLWCGGFNNHVAFSRIIFSLGGGLSKKFEETVPTERFAWLVQECERNEVSAGHDGFRLHAQK